jgi:CBS domain-containing protein
VRAAGIATGVGRVLYPDDPVQRASALFGASKDDCLPVVTREEPQRLLGIVRRRDILRLLIRRQPGDRAG